MARAEIIGGLVWSLVCVVCAVSLVSVWGCGGEHVRLDKPSGKPVVVDEAADPHALLADIRAAQASDPEVRDLRLEDVSKAWAGRRVSWEVGILAPLCRHPGACMALPFDHARLERPAGQGWLPRIELEDGEHARLREACAGMDTCVVSVEATVERVRLSSELPTAVTLHRARMLSARAARPSESWARRPEDPARGRGSTHHHR